MWILFRKWKEITMKKFGLCFVSLFLALSSCKSVPPGKGDLIFRIMFPRDLKPGKKIPMVTLLHGCDQSADEIIRLSGLIELAQKKQFAVLTVEQHKANNPKKCFNWFDDKSRKMIPDSEAYNIAEGISGALQDRRINRSRSYLIGLSAGGAMAGLLLSCRSNLFAAAAIHSAPSFLRANTEQSAWQLMLSGKADKTIPACKSFKQGSILVIQGDKDKIVHPDNANLIFEDLAVKNQSKLMMVKDLAHAWSGGKEGYTYSDHKTASATDEILKFFKF